MELILKRCLPNVPHLCTFFLSELRLYRYFVLGLVFSSAFVICNPMKADRGKKKAAGEPRHFLVREAFHTRG